MSWLNTRNLIIGAGGVGAVAFLFPRSVAKASPVNNVFETPAVKSIGDRYSAGGGSNTHMPAVATQRGNSDATNSPQLNPKGVDTAHFQDRQAEQKVGTPGKVDAAFRSAHYGENNTKGK